MEIRRNLANRIPGNARWDYDLSYSHNWIGDVQMAQRDFDGALRSYQAGMDIRRKSAEQGFDNPEKQHEVATSHGKLGDVQRAQGDFSGALKNFQTRLEIMHKLAERGPDYAEWQTDLAESCLKLAQLDPLGPSAQPTVERRALLQRGLAVLEALQRRGRLTPDKLGMLGDVRQALQALN